MIKKSLIVLESSFYLVKLETILNKAQLTLMKMQDNKWFKLGRRKQPSLEEHLLLYQIEDRQTCYQRELLRISEMLIK